MEGLVSFAAEVGHGFAVMLPTFCYIAAIGLFLFSGWGFWLQGQPINPFQGKPWIPVVSLILCGAFASFDTILTRANISLGTNVGVSLSSQLTSYDPATNSDVLGATPGDSLINIVTEFQSFFQAFGAMCCFFAVLSWRAVINGRSNHSQVGAGIQFLFGCLLINILPITQGLVGIFQEGQV